MPEEENISYKIEIDSYKAVIARQKAVIQELKEALVAIGPIMGGTEIGHACWSIVSEALKAIRELEK